MNRSELTARLSELARNPTPEYLTVKERWKNVQHIVRVNGKWRPEGAITALLSLYEQVRFADPSLPPLPQPDLFGPEMLNRMFGIPLEAFGDRFHLGGRIGRPITTKDLADFAHERRKTMTWKEIAADWKQHFPDDPRKATDRNFLEAHCRHYGSKKRL
jgi:hypothetical protein